MPVRPKVLAVVAIVAAAAGMLLARAALNPPEPPPTLAHATLLPAPRALPDFALLDQDGQPFSRQRLQGHWSFLFFGFTSCPAICPTTLGVLAQARHQLETLPAAQRPQVVLVSVDPEHDTPAQLKSYLHGFHDEFLGLTGNAAELQRLSRALPVSITMRQLEGGAYTVDHTTAIFLVDPRGAWRAVFSTPHSPGAIADDYRRILAFD